MDWVKFLASAKATQALLASLLQLRFRSPPRVTQASPQ